MSTPMILRLLAVVAVMALAGCDDSGSTTGGSSGTTVPSSRPAEARVLRFSAIPDQNSTVQPTL